MKKIDNPYRLWRISNFMTCAEIAAMAGVTRQSVAAFERGVLQSEKIKDVYDGLMQAAAELDAAEVVGNGKA